MNVLAKVAASCIVAVGTAGLVGCDGETVQKDETVRTHSDGSQTKSIEEVKQDADGVITKTEETVKTPATQVN